MTLFQIFLGGAALVFIPFGILVALKGATAAVNLITTRTGAVTGTISASKWYTLPLYILVVVAAFALLLYSPQLLFIGLGVAVAGYALKVLSTKPPSSWITIALVALVLLFLGWTPTWRYVERTVSWYEGKTTMQQKSAPNEVYQGRADGRSYTLTGNTWLLFDWPYNHCVRYFPADGVLEESNMNRHTTRLLSRGGDRILEVRTLSAGETWKGYTC